ncbi:MAG: ABC transporter permease [Bacteroidota bacterium]
MKQHSSSNITTHAPQTFSQIVWQKFRQRRSAIWSLRGLYVLIFIAVFADFIANDKPIIGKVEQEIYFPIFRELGEQWGICQVQPPPSSSSWSKQTYDWSILPPIPYSIRTFDTKNSQFTSPFDEQRVESMRYWHWLGTDRLGRDVAACMISGTRTAMLVGLISMSISAIIGIFFGAMAGYFGNDRLQVGGMRVLLSVTGVILGIFYGFIARSYTISESSNIMYDLGVGIFIMLCFVLGCHLLAKGLQRIMGETKRWAIPADSIVMRSVEIMNSIPKLLLLLAIIAIIDKPSILYVMIIIGCIGWTGIARFMRAELLRIRQLEYIEAAQAMGFSERRVILRHAIPNALTPVLITIAFGIAGAILLESALSFLGLGASVNEVTWGTMLKLARENFSAWWLAIVPGIAIFVTVTIFNLIGEGLTEALDPKSRT